MSDIRDRIQKAPATVQANIETVTALEQQSEEQRSLVDRIADVIGSFSGTMTFVGLHVTWFAVWFLINTGALKVGIPKFDPYPFILLAMIVSVEGVLLSTFVLMKQNRMQQKSDARDHLNLQIDLLAEKEVTKSLQMLRAVCKKLEISEADFGDDLNEMATTTSVDTLAQSVQEKMSEGELE